MGAFQAAALYAGLNILILLALALLVVRQRLTHKVPLGHGGIEPLERAQRVHANGAEYAPAAIAGLVALALAGGEEWTVHVGGLLITIGRVLHGAGLSMSSGISFGRQAGTLLTWIAFVWIGAACILTAF